MSKKYFVIIAICFILFLIVLALSYKRTDNGTLYDTEYVKLDEPEVVVCAGGVVRYKLSDLNVCAKDSPSAAVSSRGIGGKHSLLFAVRMDKSMFQDIHDMIKMNDLYKTKVMDWDIDYDGELYQVKNWSFKNLDYQPVLNGPGWYIAVVTIAPKSLVQLRETSNHEETGEKFCIGNNVYIEYKNRNLYYYTYDELGDRSPISAADAEKLLEESGFTLQAAKKIAMEHFERKVKK